MHRYAFTPCYRIRRPIEYRRLFDGNPTALSSRCFRVLSIPNSFTYPRLGVIVSKRCSKLAVRRNGVKRIVRDYFRQHRHALGNVDIVVIAKVSCFTGGNQAAGKWSPAIKKQLRKDLTKLWQTLINNT